VKNIIHQFRVLIEPQTRHRLHEAFQVLIKTMNNQDIIAFCVNGEVWRLMRIGVEDEQNKRIRLIGGEPSQDILLKLLVEQPTLILFELSHRVLVFAFSLDHEILHPDEIAIKMRRVWIVS
jgi:hypothetical protein